MKQAKVVNGVVQFVWPWTKTLPDGTVLTKELPRHFVSHEIKFGKRHDLIVDVPDDVRPGWVWHEDLQAYAPRVKHISPKPKPHSDLLEVVAEKIGVPYDSLWEEVIRRKKERKAALKK